MTRFCAADHSTLRNAHIAAAHAADAFELVSLTKAGAPSKMWNARATFATEERALAVVARVRSLNPRKTLRYALNGVEV